MIVTKSLNISQHFALLLGVLFYTSIGLLFIMPDVLIRVFVFLLVLSVANFKKSYYLIIAFSFLIGYIINPVAHWETIIFNVLSWGTLVGCILGSILIYQDIFTGGDYASISRFFKKKNKVAIHSYYVFKIIPMIFDLLVRLAKAYRVYGKRKYVNKNKVIAFGIFSDVVDSFFNELLTLMFSQIRILNRREAASYFVSQGKREVNMKLFVVQILIILLVITSSILYFLNVNIQYMDMFI